jgi:NADP-dependent 3-hydroxy acid dehydrogenase YdfG
MSYELGDLIGKVFVITGATSGVGQATAIELVAQGAKVALNARDNTKLSALVSKLGSANAIGVAGDCSKPEVCRSLAKAAIGTFGTIDGVIPNAGVGLYGSILDYTDEEVNQMMRTNFEGTVHLVRACVPTMIDKAIGDIVIVSSVAGFYGAGKEAIYAGTKHAQVGLANGLDHELREKGIRVALICPAGISTNFAFGSGRNPNMPKLATYLRPEEVAHQIIHVLRQPKSMRTFIWTMWSMQQESN